MTDRDEFAKAAMQALITNPSNEMRAQSDFRNICSKQAYAMADAMLAEQGPKPVSPHDVTIEMVRAVEKVVDCRHLDWHIPMPETIIAAVLSRHWEQSNGT